LQFVVATSVFSIDRKRLRRGELSCVNFAVHADTAEPKAAKRRTVAVALNDLKRSRATEDAKMIFLTL
jgi:hypothetical protein